MKTSFTFKELMGKLTNFTEEFMIRFDEFDIHTFEKSVKLDFDADCVSRTMLVRSFGIEEDEVRFETADTISYWVDIDEVFEK